MRKKSIPTTIPCPDSLPSYLPARAALTSYIINRRWVPINRLERMRDKSIPQQFTDLMHRHLISRIKLHLHATLSTEDELKYKASNESGTNPFQQQFLVQIHRPLINGLELHSPPILSTEDGWQWKASNE